MILQGCRGEGASPCSPTSREGLTETCWMRMHQYGQIGMEKSSAQQRDARRNRTESKLWVIPRKGAKWVDLPFSIIPVLRAKLIYQATGSKWTKKSSFVTQPVVKPAILFPQDVGAKSQTSLKACLNNSTLAALYWKLLGSGSQESSVGGALVCACPIPVFPVEEQELLLMAVRPNIGLEGVLVWQAAAFPKFTPALVKH